MSVYCRLETSRRPVRTLEPRQDWPTRGKGGGELSIPTTVTWMIPLGEKAENFANQTL